MVSLVSPKLLMNIWHFLHPGRFRRQSLQKTGKKNCFHVLKTSTQVSSLHYLGSGMKMQACLHQPSWPSWNRRLWQGCCVTMGTTSHASSRTCFGWRSILMATAAATTSRKSTCACGKTAVKVTMTTLTLSTWSKRAFVHKLKAFADIVVDTPERHYQWTCIMQRVPLIHPSTHGFFLLAVGSANTKTQRFFGLLSCLELGPSCCPGDVHGQHKVGDV